MCYGMDYKAEPDYKKLKFVMIKVILNINKVPGGNYL